ncbi:MAG: carboxypeptidase-like regulatory domain-containing protein [Bacteroidales bacterium]|nr:carboxypeptidase-like regulatory domain-containing protein [Bacteroidales bacterium]
MKKHIIIRSILLLSLLFILQQAMSFGRIISFSEQEDTTSFIKLEGKVVNAENENPVIFASVFIEGTHIGTITNTEGRFILKVPSTYFDHKIGFSSLGYKQKFMAVSSMKDISRTIRLQPDVIPIPAVIVRKLDPVSLIKEAEKRISENYGKHPAMMTAFYRETIRKGTSKYLSVGEAVLNVYKAPYSNNLDMDRVSVYKGRKAIYVKREDTLMVKLQGGPVTAFYLDLAKNPGDILSQDVFDYYDYSMGGQVKIDGRTTYVIHFDQKDTVSIPLYRGTLYLDTGSLAIVQAEYEISPKKIDQAARYLILKKPARLHVDVLSAAYLVKYRHLDGKWVLNYMRLENHFRTKWTKKLFRSNYTILSEAAVTDIDYENVKKPKYRESFKWNKIFTEEVSAFEDPDFWGPNNVIQPEESIQAAIQKISRKLKKHE